MADSRVETNGCDLEPRHHHQDRHASVILHVYYSIQWRTPFITSYTIIALCVGTLHVPSEAQKTKTGQLCIKMIY